MKQAPPARTSERSGGRLSGGRRTTAEAPLLLGLLLRGEFPVRAGRQTQEIVRRLHPEVDFIAWELRPAALDEVGIAAALVNSLGGWPEHYGVKAGFHASLVRGFQCEISAHSGSSVNGSSGISPVLWVTSEYLSGTSTAIDASEINFVYSHDARLSLSGQNHLGCPAPDLIRR